MDSFTVGAFWAYCLILFLAAHLVVLTVLVGQLRILRARQREAQREFIERLKTLTMKYPETMLKDIVWISVEDFFR